MINPHIPQNQIRLIELILIKLTEQDKMKFYPHTRCEWQEGKKLYQFKWHKLSGHLDIFKGRFKLLLEIVLTHHLGEKVPSILEMNFN
jgi:hypothetical protein